MNKTNENSLGELATDVVVVSVFGRGHWMAVELAKTGMKVTLLDVTESMGLWAPEDWEGPFGVFTVEGWQDSQIQRMHEDDVPMAAIQGMTFLMPDGPYELKGPLTKYRQEMKSNDPSSLNQWLEKISHFYGSNRFALNRDYSKHGRKAPLFQPFHVRFATRLGHAQSLRWCKDHQVEVIEKLQIVDIHLKDRKTAGGFEVKLERPGLLRADQVVWCLSAEETTYLNQKLGQTLFPGVEQKSEWCWMKFRFRFQECAIRHQLPIHFVLFEDLMLPWTHENVLLVQRTGSDEKFDVWMMLPTHQRFHRQYLETIAKRAQAVLTQRIPDVVPQILDYPQEYHYTYEQMGPPRYPVFGKQFKKITPHLNNVYADGPESWDSYLWSSRFAANEQKLTPLKLWWQKKEELRIKQEKKLEEKLKEQDARLREKGK